MIERQRFFTGAQADTEKGQAMSPGTSASGGTRHGGGGGNGGGGPPSIKNPPKGPTKAEIEAKKKAEEAKKKAEIEKKQKENLKNFKTTQKKKKNIFDKWGEHAKFSETIKNLGNTENYHQLAALDFMNRFNVKPETAKKLAKGYQSFTEDVKAAINPFDDYTFDKAEKRAETEAALNAIGIDAYGKDNELTQEYATFTDAGTKKYLATGGVARKNFSIGSSGILDIDETEGEEISLTAEGPQLTEEERLRIESEKEEGDDEDVKRIDLFASEEGEGDPLNNLLLGEDGITTLFQAKDGGSPQLVKKSKDGKRPGYRGPGGYQSGQSDPASDDDQGETESGSGFSGGNQNTGGGGNNYSVQDDLTDFATNVGKEADPSGGFKDGDGDNRDNYKDKILSMVDKKKIPGTKEYIEEEKTNYVFMPEKKLVMSKGVRPAAIVPLETKRYYDKLDQYIADNTGLLSAYNLEKTITNAIIDQIPVIGRFLPDQYPSVNINFENIGKYEVPGSDLGFYDPDKYPEFYKDGPDKKEDSDDPIIEQIIAANQAIEERDETDIFNIWDKIKEKQAQRALLVEKGIIQDTSEMPQTKEAMMLNSGGLANLFRVKTQ
jgi:hypothetical protein